MSLNLEQMHAVLTVLPDPLFVLTESGRYAGVFGGRDTRFYYDSSVLLDRSLDEVLPAEKAEWFLAQVAMALREARLCIVEYALSSADVEGVDPDKGPSGELWFEGRIQPLPFLIGGERAVLWAARNITRRHNLEEELRRKSEVDELTGAFNRRKLFTELGEKFREYLRYKEPTALLMLDIDHFKRINDRFGHVAGDVMLRATAQICLKQLRDVDTFARFGGEEFVVLMPHTGIEEARHTAERLRLAVERQSVSQDGEVMCVTISIGISTMTETDTGFESVLKQADEALYAAKRAGRNCVVVAGEVKDN